MKHGRKAALVVALGAVSVSLVAAGVASAAPARAGARTTVGVIAGKPSELKFKLTKLSVPKGTVTFQVRNRGVLQHDFKIKGKKTVRLMPGRSATLVVRFARAGRFQFLCTVSGHATGGMKGNLTVR